MELLIESTYTLHDSCDLPPQKEIKSLIVYAEENRLEFLLDTNFYHVDWRSSDINSKRESLHDFILD